jgi:peptidyl-prolyl cis-trans isomerase C
MVSSLYRQQVLAGKARAAGLALPSSASSLTEVQANRELANVYLQQEAQKRMPTAAAVERYAKAQYTQNSSGYEHGEMFRVSHILVTVKEGVRTEAQARERAQSVIDRLAKGEDFGALAAEFSDDQGSRHEKGSLNYREAKELPEDFVSVLQSMAGGSRSVEPMRTKAGYHVIWLQEKRPAGRLSFDDMRDQLMTQASAQLATRATRTVWDEALTGFTLNTAHLDQVVAAMRGAR